MGDLDEVLRREQLLLDPAVRADAAKVTGLLHPDFVEFGKSGRVWDRESILAMMTADPSVSGPASMFVPVHLSDGVVLLTYRTSDETRRSSVWVRDELHGWLLRFHQGTPAPRTEAELENQPRIRTPD